MNIIASLLIAAVMAAPERTVEYVPPAVMPEATFTAAVKAAGETSQPDAIVFVNANGTCGTGAIVGADGETAVVLTAAHVIDDTKAEWISIVVPSTGQKVRAIATQKQYKGYYDWAAIAIPDPGVAPIERAHKAPEIGDEITFHGYAGSLPRYRKVGGKVARSVDGGFWIKYALARFGDSGGPATNADGDMVGVVSMRSSDGETFICGLPYTDAAWHTGIFRRRCPPGGGGCCPTPEGDPNNGITPVDPHIFDPPEVPPCPAPVPVPPTPTPTPADPCKGLEAKHDADVTDLTSQIDALKNQLDGLESGGDADQLQAQINALKKTVAELEASLAAIESKPSEKGDKGDPGTPGAKGDKGDPGDAYNLTPEDKQDIANIVVGIIEPEIPTEGITHLVLVRDASADYWTRMSDEVDRAKGHYSSIEVADPPPFSVPLPQLIAYSGGVAVFDAKGVREVSDTLSAITRDTFQLLKSQEQ